MFRAGDTVLHLSGEKWVLACDEDRGLVVAAGWPEEFVRATAVTLVQAATDAERLAILRECADTNGPRAALAKRQLDAEKGGA